MALLCLTGCAVHTDYDWDDKNFVITCGSTTVTPSGLYQEIKPDAISYMKENGTYDEWFSYEKPSLTGHKRENDQHLIRYDFTIPRDDAPFGFDGGSSVTVNACSKEMVSTGYLVY